VLEAASSSFADLFAAVDVATSYVTTGGGKGEVSMSWDGSEFSSEAGNDGHFSVASPSLAGIVNLAGQFASNSTGELTTIYNNLGNASDFRDITSGSADSFTATTGWDFVTGVGSNQGLSGK